MVRSVSVKPQGNMTRSLVIALTILILSFGIYMIMNSMKETFVNSVRANDPYAVPYNVVLGKQEEPELPPIPSLDYSNCSKDCCEIGKMSNMSCLRGCVCKNEANDMLLTSRGGNRSTNFNEF